MLKSESQLCSNPHLEEFKQKAKSGNLIPVYKEILADLDTPVSAYMKISKGNILFYWKVLRGEKNGRVIAFWVAIHRLWSLPKAGP